MSNPASQAPPHDLDAERAVLGSLLLENGLIDEVLRVLSARDFYLPGHRAAYQAIASTYARVGAVDVVLLRDELERVGTLAKMGGRSALEALAAVPSPANAVHYAKLIREAAAKRAIIDAVRDAGDAARNGHSAAAVLGDLRARVDELAEDLGKEAGPLLSFRTVGQLREMPASSAEWLVEGLLAAGEVTLLAAGPKVGKSTLVAGLLRALELGEPFAGFPTGQTSAVYLSEEPAALVLEKARAFDVRSTVYLVREDFPASLSFRDCIAAAAKEARHRGARLLVVDTFARFARFGRDEEKDASAVEAALEPVLAAAAGGLAVLILHHHRKADGEFGEQIRGSSAILAAVDTVIELRRLKEERGPIRVLECQGRHQETPDEPITIELRNGQYVPLGSADQVRLGLARSRVLEILQAAPAPMTRDEVLDAAGGKRAGMAAALYSLAKDETVRKTGRGRAGDPFRYAHLSPGVPGRPEHPGQHEPRACLSSCPSPVGGTGETGEGRTRPDSLFGDAGTGTGNEWGGE